MKTTLFICFLFFSFQNFAQIKKKPIAAKPPLIETAIINSTDTITINEEELGKNVIKTIPLHFTIKSVNPQALLITTKIINIPEDNVHISPLNDGVISIPTDQYISSTIINGSLQWIAFGVLNLNITADKKVQDKRILIIKENDESHAYSVLIQIKKDAPLPVKANNETNRISTNEKEPVMAAISTDLTSANNETSKPLQPNTTTIKPADQTKNDETTKNDEQKKTKIKIEESPETVLQVLYTKNKKNTDETQDTIQIHLSTEGCATFNKTHTDTVIFQFDNLSFPDGSITILDPEKILKSSDWDTGTCNTTVVLHIKKTNVDTLQNDQMASIKIKNGSEETHLLRLSASGLYKTTPFWLELGTNFDLLDKIEMNNLYGGVFMFKKDIARVSKKHAFSFTAGFYESKSSSSLNSSDSGLIYRDNSSFFADSTNRYPYYRDTGSFNTTTSVRSIGLFFSPHYRIDKKLADEDGFHWFASFYAEMLWQRVKVSYDYQDLHRAQTSYVSISQTGIDSLQKIRFKEKEQEYDYRSHYLGLGLPIYIKDGNFNFYLNTVFGFSTQKFILINSLDTTNKRNKYPFAQTKQELIHLQSSFAQPKHNWTPFYLLQFRLNEEGFGASITGEIRGLLLQNTKPVISISVSKKFNLPALLKNIVAPFGLGG